MRSDCSSRKRHVLASCLRCVRGFLDFGSLFRFSFFRENQSPSSTLVGLISEAMIFIFKNSLVRFLFFALSWLVLIFLVKSAPRSLFSSLDLGVFLEYSSGHRPQVGLFVSRCSALRPILFTLYPLIHQSLVRYHSEMDPIEYRTSDVRSTELETRLSSNVESLNQVVDTAISKLPSSSSSCPLHAISKSCSLKESHLKGFRKRF